MSFIHDDVLLKTELARRLYHEVAEPLPIIDYHCHLPPADVARNRRFNDLFEIWLEGDHYKWRAMRGNGVAERFCTGDAPPYEKFLAWARTMPCALRNPLYPWSHLELKRYFDVDVLLDESTAPAVWEQANARLQDPDRDAHGILKSFRVEAVCTTDDPADDLAAHRAIAASSLETKVLPTFRPDALLRIDDPSFFNPYVERLGAAADTDVATFDGLLDALRRRHDFFHEIGCRLSDHGLGRVTADFATDAEVATIYDRARSGRAVGPEDIGRFATALLLYTGQLDAERGWVKQIHLGALRNNNRRLFKTLGRDIGCDSVGDWPQAEALSALLGRMDDEGALPKTILYNLNPADNYVLATMIGNFQDGSVPGKMQFGAAWWFLDQREGMRWQMNALSNAGLLSRFVGMLTDSRSFMSYPRHEYFRRLLCDLLGDDAAAGEIPDDFELLARMVRDISHDNAARYFGFA